MFEDAAKENVPPKENVPTPEAPQCCKLLRKRLNKTRCVRRLQGKVKGLEDPNRNQKVEPTVEGILAATSQILPPATQSFLKLQLKLSNVRPKGRRYTEEELAQSLAIFFQGARAYRQLRKRFILPSTRALRRRLKHIQLMPGSTRPSSPCSKKSTLRRTVLRTGWWSCLSMRCRFGQS